MRIMNTLRENAITIAFGLKGIACSFYFYTLSMEKREPVFYVDQNRAYVLSIEYLETSPIKVWKSGGEEVTSDLTSLRFYFWNQGRRPISSADVLEPIRFTLGDSTSEILDFRILNRSRNITGSNLSRDSSDSEHSIIYSFNILEQNDGISGQILIQGEPDTKLDVSGIVVGPSPISTELPGFSKYKFALKMFGFAMIILIGFPSFKLFMNSNKFGPTQKFIATLAFFLIMGVMVLLPPQQKPLSVLSESIPSTLLPIHEH
jgi:hypothetical protein